MDGLAVRMLANEWQTRFVNARIEKIHQPAERELVLTLRSRREIVRLLLSAHKMFARAHQLRLSKPANPSEPPMFCMLLRKHIEGGKIVGVRQHEWDRVLELLIENLDEIGDVKHYVLILEMMGKHSNLMLCSASPSFAPERIVDSMVHVTPDISRFRLVLPGQPYKAPPAQDKVAPTEVTANHLEAVSRYTVDDLEDVSRRKPLVRELMNTISGIGPWTAHEAIVRAVSAHRDREESLSVLLAQSIRDLCESTLQGAESASIGLDELGRPHAAAPFHFTAFTNVMPALDLSDAIERVYGEMQTSVHSMSAASALERSVLDLMDKLRGKLNKLREELNESQHHEALRVKGELLTTYAYQVAKGETKVYLPNYYEDNALVEIDLDPALSPIENAQRYFRMASKRKRAKQVLDKEIESVHNDLTYLENVLVHIHGASSDNLSSIRAELEQQGFLTQSVQKKRTKSASSTANTQPDAYHSCDGLIIRVGRNNLQNDRLTLKSSQPSDIWLHVKDLPGSHVVISANRGVVPESTLYEAALLAAYFSKGKDSANVAVDYCEIKNVWKPNGARPGHVLYKGQKTFSVTPDRTFIDPILKRKLN